MKKITSLLVLFVLVLTSCLPPNTHLSRTQKFEDMVAPIIVIGLSPRVVHSTTKSGNPLNYSRGTVTLSDKNGSTVWFLDNEPLGASFISSYELGDTILFIKK